MAYSSSHAPQGGAGGYYSAMVAAASNLQLGSGSTQPSAHPHNSRYQHHQSQQQPKLFNAISRGPTSLNQQQSSPYSVPTPHHQNLPPSPVYGASSSSPSSSSAFQHKQPSPLHSYSNQPPPSPLNAVPTNVMHVRTASNASGSGVGGGAQGRRYRHNPYGSGSEPNTPTLHATQTLSPNQSGMASLSQPPAAAASHFMNGPGSMNTSMESSASTPHSSLMGGGGGGLGVGVNAAAAATTFHKRRASGSGSMSFEQRANASNTYNTANTNAFHSSAHNGHGPATSSTNHFHHQHTNSQGAASADASSTLAVVEQFNASIGSLASFAMTLRGRNVLNGIIRQQNERLAIIFGEIGPCVGTLALDANGHQVVRTLLDHTTPEQNQIVVDNITNEQVLGLATDSQHSRRILQTLFERFQGRSLDRVVMVIAREAAALAVTQQGCITVMRVVEHGMPHQRQMVLDALVGNLAQLTMDPYGNYVVQAILDYTDATAIRRVVVGAFRGHWVQLCCHKFASNVMEKVVRIVTGPSREELLDELLGRNDLTVLSTLVSDGYGNFVVQAIIDSAGNVEEVSALAERIRPALGTSPYAHRIEARLKGSATGTGPVHQRHNNAQRNRASHGKLDDHHTTTTTAAAARMPQRSTEGANKSAPRRSAAGGASAQHQYASKNANPSSGNGPRYASRGGESFSGNVSSMGSNSSTRQHTSSSNESSTSGCVAPHVPQSRRGGRA